MISECDFQTVEAFFRRACYLIAVMPFYKVNDLAKLIAFFVRVKELNSAFKTACPGCKTVVKVGSLNLLQDCMPKSNRGPKNIPVKKSSKYDYKADLQILFLQVDQGLNYFPV